MKLRQKSNLWLVFGTMLVTCTLPVTADTIYDNSVNDLSTHFDPGTNQVGDEILLAGTFRSLTNFSFEYWRTNTAGGPLVAGSVTAVARCFNNDGTPFNGFSTPGTMLSAIAA